MVLTTHLLSVQKGLVDNCYSSYWPIFIYALTNYPNDHYLFFCITTDLVLIPALFVILKLAQDMKSICDLFDLYIDINYVLFLWVFQYITGSYHLSLMLYQCLIDWFELWFQLMLYSIWTITCLIHFPVSSRLYFPYSWCMWTVLFSP